MIRLLEEKIDDKRFIKIIKGMLKAGYLEDWTYHNTYSGTPQGGIILPTLSNIYLNELDDFIERFTIKFNKGKTRALNPEYRKLTNQIRILRQKINEQGKKPELMEKYRELGKLQINLSSTELKEHT